MMTKEGQSIDNLSGIQFNNIKKQGYKLFHSLEIKR